MSKGSDVGSLIGFGAVAVLAAIVYKKTSELMQPKQAADTASKIVETASGGKEVIREVIIQTTDSGKDSGKFDPLSWYGIFGSQEPNWYKKLLGKDEQPSGQPVKPAAGISKTYGTGDKEYDKYVDKLTEEWVSNIQKNKEQNMPSGGGQPSTGQTISLQEAASRSWDDEVRKASGGTSSKTSVITGNKSNTPPGQPYKEGGQTKYIGSDGKVNIVVKR